LSRRSRCRRSSASDAISPSSHASRSSDKIRPNRPGAGQAQAGVPIHGDERTEPPQVFVDRPARHRLRRARSRSRPMPLPDAGREGGPFD
jgi:hypothetical protein